jgi:hypothetical protein
MTTERQVASVERVLAAAWEAGSPVARILGGCGSTLQEFGGSRGRAYRPRCAHPGPRSRTDRGSWKDDSVGRPRQAGLRAPCRAHHCCTRRERRKSDDVRDRLTSGVRAKVPYACPKASNTSCTQLRSIPSFSIGSVPRTLHALEPPRPTTSLRESKNGWGVCCNSRSSCGHRLQARLSPQPRGVLQLARGHLA